MAVELPRPGVEIIQVIRTITPTIVQPALPPHVVGACKQIVPALSTAAGGGQQPNSEALVGLPAYFMCETDGGLYSWGATPRDLVVSINGSVDVTISFVNDMTVVDVVEAINTALVENGVTGALATFFQDRQSDGSYTRTRWRFATTGSGSFNSIDIKTGTSSQVCAAFGIAVGQQLVGRSTYDQRWFKIPYPYFPDPRQNLNELEIFPESVRAFLALGNGSLKEALRTESFLRSGGVLAAVDDGNGDLLTPFVSSATESFNSAATLKVITGITIASELSGMTGKTLILDDGYVQRTYTFDGSETRANLASKLDAFFNPDTLNPTLVFEVAVNVLSISTVDYGSDAHLDLVGGTALADIGLVPALTGTADVDPVPVLTGKKFTLTLDGTDTTHTFTGEPATPAALLLVLAAAFPTLDFSVDATPYVIIEGKVGGPRSIVVKDDIAVNDAADELGFALAAESTVVTTHTVHPVATGDYLYVDGSFLGIITQVASGGVAGKLKLDRQIQIPYQAPTFTGTEDITASALYGAAGTLAGTTLILTVSGTQASCTFGSGTSAPASYSDMLAALALAIPSCTFTKTALNRLNIAGKQSALVESLVVTDTLSNTAASVLGFVLAASSSRGRDVGTYFTIQAKNLRAGQGVTVRPKADLTLDLNSYPSIKADMLRSPTGTPVSGGVAKVFVSYTALRLDVTPLAERPGLLSFSNTDDIDSLIGPISAANPLALGLYFALLNCQGFSVTGLGVDEVSADMPDGTVEAFTRAANFLEGVDVYGIAPLTHSSSVAQVFNAHVNAMSDPSVKAERVCVFCMERPTHAVDTLVASGVEGNSTGTVNVFDTGIPTLSELLVAQGLDPTSTIPCTDGLFLDIASDSGHYSIASVDGPRVTIRSTFTGGDNSDGFYAEPVVPGGQILPSPLIDEPFAIRVRGTPLTLTNGKPDKQAIASTYADMASGFLNRRFWHVVPDECAASIGGIEQVIPGYYMCAAIVGAVGRQKPSVSFTNFPLAGFTRVIGSNDFFSDRQLNLIAGGGNWIMVQDVAGAPILCRMALTTDMTSIELRTESVTKILDFMARLMRASLKNFIGRYNITQSFKDALSSAVQGVLAFSEQLGVIISGSLNAVIQNENQPDMILVDVMLDLPLPCNYIRVTLTI